MDDEKSSNLLDFSPNLQEYKRTLPRRKKQRSKNECCGLSSTSWVFLVLALLQGMCRDTVPLCTTLSVKPHQAKEGFSFLNDFVLCLGRGRAFICLVLCPASLWEV